jgi:hypothetical protein
MDWQVGIQTVPQRLRTDFPNTICSILKAGFPEPRVFADGGSWAVYSKYVKEVSAHVPNLKTSANWVCSLVELYLRCPNADRYAIFEDDCIVSKNAREYLECHPFTKHRSLGDNPHQHAKVYLNLYTNDENQTLCAKDGWNKSNQRGKGAVALVFDNDGVQDILSTRYLWNVAKIPDQWRKIDGVIQTALVVHNSYTEYVHSPSIVKHVGYQSVMGHRWWGETPSFRGEDFDLSTLLKK